jgi:hypothetical protein
MNFSGTTNEINTLHFASVEIEGHQHAGS